ncbi:MAG: hypothetical protein KatS3mg031_1198 [Chitinophagales bacterium]|nr:MAG: hypothetical protein KatS3mg031_1198 [Chitinophagales bacterium]
MFNNKKTEIPPKTSLGGQTNQFSEGTIIEGGIKSTNDIRLDGVVHGNIQSSAKVVIGQNGRVEGELRCQNADISGAVKGKIEVKEVLFLKATAEIEGDIITNKLVVEAGARFNGSCTMGNTYQMHDEQSALKKEAV